MVLNQGKCATRVRRLIVVLAFLPSLVYAETDGPGSAVELLPADVVPAEAIDFYVEQRLQRLGITPAQPSSPHVLLRRITLDLAGRIPTTGEIKDYAQNRTTLPLHGLVSHLVDSHWYVRHTARELNSLLKGMGGTDRSWSITLRMRLRETAVGTRCFGNLWGHRGRRFVPNNLFSGGSKTAISLRVM